jgi:uncharacterized membrane protein
VSLYKILLFVHITAIAIWVGGGFMLALTGARAAKAGPPPREMVVRNLETAEWLGTHFYAPVMLVTLISGIWLVLEIGYGFGHFFVIWGLGTIVLTGTLGMTFFVPRAKALIARVNEKGVDAEAQASLAQIGAVSKLVTGLLILTIFVMTYKPFS